MVDTADSVAGSDSSSMSREKRDPKRKTEIDVLYKMLRRIFRPKKAEAVGG